MSMFRFGYEQPILNKMTDEQESDKIIWTPSKMIERLGKEIDNEDSIYYWCAKVLHSPYVSYTIGNTTYQLLND